MNHEEKINELIGQTFLYTGKKFEINSFKKVNGLFVLMTNQGTRNFHEYEINNFINALKPFEEKEGVAIIRTDLHQAKVPEQKVTIVNPATEAVKNALLKQLEELSKPMTDEERKGVIATTKSVCEVVSEYAKIQKNEADIYNMLTK